MIYTAKQEPIESRPGCWNTLKVSIFQNGEKVGEFDRNYSSFGESTFAPFCVGEKWYALFSPKYTGLRVMTLPDCKDIGGEGDDACGFCPVEVLVPEYRLETIHATKPDELDKYPKENHVWLSKDRYEMEFDPELWDSESEMWSIDKMRRFSPFAFVAGCVWGDDRSWKIEMRDLRQVERGIISRVDIGYLEMPGCLSLKEAVTLSGCGDAGVYVSLAVQKNMTVSLKDGLELKYWD